LLAEVICGPCLVFGSIRAVHGGWRLPAFHLERHRRASPVSETALERGAGPHEISIICVVWSCGVDTELGHVLLYRIFSLGSGGLPIGLPVKSEGAELLAAQAEKRLPAQAELDHEWHVARIAEIEERIKAAVACEDFEAARLKEELVAAQAEALAAWQTEEAEARDQVDKSKSALDAAEESPGVAKQALFVEEVALKEVDALLKQNTAAIRAAVKDEDFAKAAELNATAVGLDRRLAAAKEAFAAGKGRARGC